MMSLEDSLRKLDAFARRLKVAQARVDLRNGREIVHLRLIDWQRDELLEVLERVSVPARLELGRGR